MEGLIWGALMFLWWCCVTLFQDVLSVLEVTIGSTIFFTATVFLATLRARWKGKGILGDNQSVG